MDLQNIQDQLNTEFAKSETRIIFWFDDKGEYEDEVSELQLGDVKEIAQGQIELNSKIFKRDRDILFSKNRRRLAKRKYPCKYL